MNIVLNDVRGRLLILAASLRSSHLHWTLNFRIVPGFHYPSWPLVYERPDRCRCTTRFESRKCSLKLEI